MLGPLSRGDCLFNAEEKESFHRKARRLLRETGSSLVEKGVSEFTEVSTNMAGPAVEGETYGYFWITDNDAVMVELSSRNGDITLMAQHREVGRENARRHRPTKSKPRPHPSYALTSNMYMRNPENRENMERWIKACILSHPSEAARARREAEILSREARLGAASKRPKL